MERGKSRTKEEETPRNEWKEIKLFGQAASVRPQSRQPGRGNADLGAAEWDNYWMPWLQKKGAEQAPPELTADPVLTTKKVDLENFEQRGVYEVVEREVLEQTPGLTILSAKWVVTKKGTPKAPVPKTRLVARECASDALDRDALFSGMPGLTSGRSLISMAATCTSSSEQMNIMLLDVTAACLHRTANGSSS